MARRPRRRLGALSINRLIPNSLTLLALCAGITAMRFAIEGQWDRAVIAIVVAAVLDGLDGRIARALGATSRFGAELDSLSDFVCFGVAPAMAVYMWSLQDLGGLGWALSLLFAVCCGLRLARFNVALDSRESTPPWTRDYFVGVPAPAGGGLAIMPLIFGLQFEHSFFASPWLNGVVLAGTAGLMVSRLPTFAFKRLKVPGRNVVPVLLAVGAFAAFLISTPWATLGVTGIVYLASIPYARIAYQRQRSLGGGAGEAGNGDEDAAEIGAPDDELT
jgi:CDP-diacylglycerol---serine O-phosphatidyltransferase